MNGKNILITGATGFIGSHVVNKIGQMSDVCNIYLLSRNTNALNNHSEIINSSFERYSIQPITGIMNKIKIIYGDIFKPRMGICNNDYVELSEKIDVIYHIAADVNHIAHYEDLKVANVDSLEFLIEIAKIKKKKIINFVSTMGAATKKDSEGKYVEDFPETNQINISMGYLKSKHEAEKILSLTGNKEMANIFRLGYISSNTETGVCLYENNQLMLFIKSCAQIGFAPNINRLINLTAVDFAANIISSSFFMNHAGNVMHLVNSTKYISWIELINFINNQGINITMVSLKDWQHMLKKAGRENALYRMLLIYRRLDADDHIIKFGKNITDYRIDNVASFCNKNKIIMPKLENYYLLKILNYLLSVGFISKKGAIQK